MPETDFSPFMREAIALAEVGRWTACPNPTVGAVLVRDGRTLARGFHHQAGQAHAEVDCFRDAAAKDIDPKGCTLVVTLEPCNHQGKTPPCTDAIIAAGVSRVVMGLADPNPVATGGAQRLREAGIEVVEDVCAQECRDLAADYLVWQKTDRPYVILKMAATLDGRIATRKGQSQWVSGEASRQEVQELRAGVGRCGGAVLVGGGTFRADNPSLTARHQPPELRQPLACVLTTRLPQPDADFHLLKNRPEQTVFLASPAVAASTAAQALRAIGVRILALGPGLRGGPDFFTLLLAMRQELGCPYVLCEGGGRLGMALLEAGFVDEFRLHLAPYVLGDSEALPLFVGRAPLTMNDALSLRVSDTHLCGGDIHIHLRPGTAGHK